MSETTIQESQTPPANVAAYYIREAATILRMSEKSVRRQIERGNLRRCTKFGKVMIPRKDVDTFYERHSAYAFGA
jgi:hypothetical protein